MDGQRKVAFCYFYRQIHRFSGYNYGGVQDAEMDVVGLGFRGSAWFFKAVFQKAIIFHDMGNRFRSYRVFRRGSAKEAEILVDNGYSYKRHKES
ncbi:MAG: hypothetical protein ACRD1R_04930 [Acidobacteriota bacterium]